eukprot:5271993-Pyramimonas_sp.AAC.1
MDLSDPGAPCYFIHGTQWEHLPSILSIGLYVAPTKPARRGAYSLCTAARAFLVTIGFSPACEMIPRCWSWFA